MAKVILTKKFLDKIVCGDAVEIMKQIPDGSVDLVVTSPPYNLKNSTGNGMKNGRGGKWAHAALQNGDSHDNDCMPHEEYVKWQRECLNEMLRIIPGITAQFFTTTNGAFRAVCYRPSGHRERFSDSPNYNLEMEGRIQFQCRYIADLRSNVSNRQAKIEISPRG